MFDVIKYLNENLDQKLTLHDTANHFGYSLWHFCVKFKQYTGKTFTEYIRHRRMCLATLDLLESGKRTVLDIALQYGYETQNGFNKAFLSEFGCMPREFKKDACFCFKKYEERAELRMKLTDRCVLLRENAVVEKTINPLISMQRHFHFLKGTLESGKGRSNGYVTACGIASTIRGSLPVIRDGELIVGYNFADYPMEWPFSEDIHALRQQLRDSMFSEEQIEWYISHKELDPYTHLPGAPLITDEKILHLSANEEQSAIGGICTSNHSVIGYEQVILKGFIGLLQEVETARTANPGKDEFYDGMALLCQAGCELGDLYAAKANEILLKPAAADNIQWKEELKTIAEVCYQVPRHPARNFREAVQSLWFAHIINTWEDTINANSLGRLDQILYPYYKRDIDSGILTKEEAFELLCCLWIKLYRDYDVQQSCVGGCKADGSDAVNELSYLMLDVTETLDFVRCLSVRYSAGSDKRFIQRALEVVGHVQKGIPFFFNDDVMIPSLVNSGISLKDARDYTQIGCVETVIPGKSNPHAVTGQVNVLKSIEYVFGDGKSLMNPQLSPGLSLGSLNFFDNFIKFKEAVLSQTRFMVEKVCEQVIYAHPMGAFNEPKPYKSLLTEGCVSRGKDFNGQGAQYDFYEICILGIPNLADSLEAINEFVYKQKKYTLEEIFAALQNDFEDEAMRLELVNKAPKFGNDIDEVDDLAMEITGICCDSLEQKSKETGFSFFAQPFSFLWMLDHGMRTFATPDGRRKGEVLAYSISPMQGRDFNGFTALLNSLCKLPTTRTPGTASAIVEVDPHLFTDKNIPVFADLLLGAAKKGLCNIQFNVVDADMLINAQQHPNHYQNLAVRVSGFSQKFHLLDKNLQDHIIHRTKHKYM